VRRFGRDSVAEGPRDFADRDAGIHDGEGEEISSSWKSFGNAPTSDESLKIMAALPS